MHGLAVISCLMLAAASAAPRVTRTVPRDRIVEALVRGLEAERYQQREDATLALRKIGEDALPALERAAESERTELRFRARLLVKDIRLGIGEEWPAELAVQTRHFDRLDEGRRKDVLRALPAHVGAQCVPFLLERLRLDQTDADEAFSALMRVRSISPEASSRIVDELKEPKTLLEFTALERTYARLGRPVAALAARCRRRLIQDPTTPAAQTMRNALESLDMAVAHEKEGRFTDAARLLETVLAAIPKNPEDEELPAEIKTWKGEVRKVLAALKERPDRKSLRPVADEPGYGIACTVTPVPKDAETDVFQKAAASAEVCLEIRVEPEGLDPFDLPGVRTWFDTGEKALQIRLHGVSLCEPVPIAVDKEKGKARVLAAASDSVRLFATTRHNAQVNGRAVPWKKRGEGYVCDALPASFPIVVEALTAEGEGVVFRQTQTRPPAPYGGPGE